ncbi:MAG: hypothetical protein AB1758_25410, partial [Candidatus Eremiobacterota bacterium]
MDSWRPGSLPGEYNRYAAPQASAASTGYAAWEAAAREVPLAGDVVRIADLASSQGLNSVTPMRRVIGILRQRSPGLSVEVTHTDLPANDFNALHQLMAGPLGCSGGQPGVFCSARAGSFYEPLFPPATIDLAWCATATHWLSRVPGPATPAAAEAWREQARRDWLRWVDCRAEELKPGGQVVMVGSSADFLGFTGAEGLMQMVRASLAELEDSPAVMP